jgi:hypothetical protein
MADPISAAATAFAQWVAATVFASVPTTVGVTTAATIANVAYITAYAVAYVGITATVTMGLNALARAQVPDPEGQKITRKQARPLRCYAVGGPSRMSGAYMLRESTGNKMAAVIAICEGRLASIDRIYLNDDRVTLSGGFVQGMANERYGGGDLIRLDTRLGLPIETHYAFLTADFGARWPTSARGDGIASLGFLAVHRSRESFAKHYPNGEPIPSIVGPPVCYDWRDEAQDRLDESTWGPCSNPIVWLVHCEWARFGRNWARCIEPVLDDLTVEAAYCDALVAKKSGGTEARYQLAGNYFSNTEPGAVREAILSTMDGWLSVDGRGCLVVKAGRYVAPTFTLTGEHIDGYSWRAFQTDEESCNELIVSYVDPAQDYTEVEAGAWRDESDISDTGRVRPESLSLPWVTSRSQAMRLAKRKMTRLNAPRRGSIRTGIHGLNALGQRYIRVQNPELASMADVVVEVTNVEIDFASSQVVLDVIMADQTIDAWFPDEEEGEQPDPVVRPPGDPAEEPAVRIPRGYSVVYRTTADDESISIVEHDAYMSDGTIISVPAGTISGLDELTDYGVFWHETEGFEAEPAPAPTHMTTGGWILIGWQGTSDEFGEYPTQPTPPGGWCPDVETPILMAAGPEKRAGDIVVGNVVLTQDETTLRWVRTPVYAVSRTTEERLAVRLVDGRSLVATPGHRVHIEGVGFRAIKDLRRGDSLTGDGVSVVRDIEPAGLGEVVRISVAGAQTYISAGVLSHNAKPIPGDGV